MGAAVLAAMQKTDEVGYLRYASVYKDFQAAGDFERELGSAAGEEGARQAPRQGLVPSGYRAAPNRSIADRREILDVVVDRILATTP